jgi:hypothetical protein
MAEPGSREGPLGGWHTTEDRVSAIPKWAAKKATSSDVLIPLFQGEPNIVTSAKNQVG